MRRKMQQDRPYFGIGNKVQLMPEERWGNYLVGLHGTILRIEQRPDPQFLDIETQEDVDWFLRIRSVHFWVKLDDFPDLDNYYKQNEVLFRYRELQPLQPRMEKQQLVQYCKEHFMKEQNEHRREAYLGIMRYPNGQWSSLSLSLRDRAIPKGYYVDLINRFINGATQIRRLAQEIRERDNANGLTEPYEIQAQVCDEMYLRLMPKQPVLPSLLDLHIR